MRRRFLASAFVAVSLLGASPAHGQIDEMTRLIVSYDLSLAKAEQVAAFYDDFAAWARTHARERKKLAADSKSASLEKTMALFEATPPIKALLDTHRLAARDVLLLPLALYSSQSVDYAEQRGVKMPAEAVNRANVTLVRTDSAKVETLSKRIAKAREAFADPR